MFRKPITGSPAFSRIWNIRQYFNGARRLARLFPNFVGHSGQEQPKSDRSAKKVRANQLGFFRWFRVPPLSEQLRESHANFRESPENGLIFQKAPPVIPRYPFPEVKKLKNKTPRKSTMGSPPPSVSGIPDCILMELLAGPGYSQTSSDT